MQTRTELHTHLMGMLSARSFVEFLQEIGIDSIYWPQPYTENSKLVSLSDFSENQLFSCLQIPHGNRVNYAQLNDYYQIRSGIIKYAIMIYHEQKGYSEEEAKKIVYNKYINKCLRELIAQGVKYVEISYSMPQVLLNFVIDEDIKDSIECRFLLSTDRSRSRSSFRKSSKDLMRVLNAGIAVGFDIMGAETAFSEEEKSNPKTGFKGKLLEILLNLIPDLDKGRSFEENELLRHTTLRLHSGETKDSLENTILILKMLEELKNEIVEKDPSLKERILPPPEIRIGHGLYFEKSEEYLRLLKEFKCIIEINASSNFALGNIEEYSQVPYAYYLNNGIPLVLSTDGHGLYQTTIQNENAIARMILGDELYRKIVEYDETILRTKVGGRR